jgi:hypothetical protein
MDGVMTDDPAVDLFAVALQAVQDMVFTAARESMPSSRFIPKFDMKPWDETELNACAGLFADAVRAAVVPA